MKASLVAGLILCLLAAASDQTETTRWNAVKDSKGVCQITVPPGWVPLSESSGAAVFHDATTAIAVVTSQPGQAFRPLPESMVKLLDLPKGKLFENTAKRIFYQEKTSRNADDTSAYSISVPVKGGTCSCRIVFLPSIPEEVARKIATSLGPVPD